MNKSLGNQNKKLSNQVGNIARQAGNKFSAMKDKISNSASSIGSAIKEKVSNVQRKVSNIGEKSEIKEPITKFGAMTQEFLTANTAISHFVTFMLCILLFIIIIQVGAKYIMYLFGPQYNPYLINGMVSAQEQIIISANPNISDSIPIYRSVDQTQGVEFSWSVWFIVQDVLKEISQPNNVGTIFTKGLQNANIPYLGVSPGLFLRRDTVDNSYINELVASISTFDGISKSSSLYETISIPNIPMKKWVCCTIRVQGTYVDVYINGVLTQRKILANLPQQNYGDTYIGDIKASFKGYISALRYYSYAISYEEIQSLFASGPSLITLSNQNLPPASDYLSMNWFYKYISFT
jgi:hypothetical protein